MKVLHLAKYYPPDPGGIERFLNDLAVEQTRQGHQVRVLAHQMSFVQKTFEHKLEGVLITRVRTFGQLAYAPVCPEFIFYLLLLLKRFKPDILHVHMPNTSAFNLLFMPLKKPIIIHWHADVLGLKPDKKLALLYPVYKIFEQALLRKARQIIATSEQYLQASQPLDRFKHKCTIIPLGLDPERYPKFSPEQLQPFREKSSTCPIVLTAGRFTYYKGFKNLIQAARYVPQAYYVFVGNGPCRKECMQLVQKLGVEKKILFPGKVSDLELYKWMAACDIFCLPSIERTEAFGLVLVEAMFYAKPLITTDVEGSGMNYVNRHKLTGLVVKPDDHKALAQGLEQLIEAENKRKLFGQTACQRAKQYFTIDQVTKRINELYCLSTQIP